MRIVWLKGDYTGKKQERQKQAAKENCNLVISFHFNASRNPKANGAEVYHNGKGNAVVVANELLRVIVNTLGVKWRKVASASGTRAAFINAYHCPAVLLEPCFITNAEEAVLIHDIKALRTLGEAIASQISKLSIPVLGIDIGHKYTTLSSLDRGARCVFGDYEADHAERLAKVVAASLLQRR